jgi:hypothetical protein
MSCTVAGIHHQDHPRPGDADDDGVIMSRICRSVSDPLAQDIFVQTQIPGGLQPP